MCKMETGEVEKTSCCSETIPESILQLTDTKSKCCVDEFDYKKIEDNFSSSNNTFSTANSIIILDSNLDANDTELKKNHSQNLNYNLPPPKFGKELLNSIHQLKLDLPVC